MVIIITPIMIPRHVFISGKGQFTKQLCLTSDQIKKNQVAVLGNCRLNTIPKVSILMHLCRHNLPLFNFPSNLFFCLSVAIGTERYDYIHNTKMIGGEQYRLIETLLKIRAKRRESVDETYERCSVF